MPNVLPGYSTKMYYVINACAVLMTVLYVIFLVYQGINEVTNPPTKITSHANKKLPMPGIVTCPFEYNVTYIAYQDFGCSVFNTESFDYTSCSVKEIEGCWYFNHGFPNDDGEANDGYDLVELGKGDQLEIFFEITAGNMSEVYYLASEIGFYNQTYYGPLFADYFWANWNQLTVGTFSRSYFTPLFFDAEITADDIEFDEWGLVTTEGDLVEHTYAMSTTSVQQNVPKDATNDDYAIVDLRIKAQSYTVVETAEFSSFGFFSVVSAVGGFWSILGGLVGMMFVATYQPPAKFRLDKSVPVEKGPSPPQAAGANEKAAKEVPASQAAGQPRAVKGW